MEDKISALMDGELDREDAAEILAQFGMTRQFRDEWAVYHMISDAMGQPGQTGPMPADISRRVSTRLVSEPAVTRPASGSAEPAVTPLRPAHRQKMKAYAVAASITAAAVVGWMNLQVAEQPPQIVADNSPPSPAPAPAPAAALPVIPVASFSAPAPVHIDDYLLTHRAFSPGTAMPGAVPYVRTVAESREISAR